jgi:hypothetical protein
MSMTSAEHKLEIFRQPANETIDRLSFTIQRQSAMTMEFVMYAVDEERRQCAAIAEGETRSNDSARLVAARIAEKIRARAGLQHVVAAIKAPSAG